MSESEKLFKPFRFLMYFLYIAYMEILFQVFVFGKASWGMLYGALFALPAAALLTLLTGIWGKWVNRVLTFIALALICVLPNVQMVYYDIFKTFMQVFSIGHGAGAALDFIAVVINSITKRLWWKILLTIVPLILLYAVPWLRHQHRNAERLNWRSALACLGSLVVLHFACLGALVVPGNAAGTPFDYYFSHPKLIENYRNLGAFPAFRTEVERTLFGNAGTPSTSGLDIKTNSAAEQSVPENSDSSMDESLTDESDVSTVDSQADESVVEPVVREPYILDIDFEKLIEEAPNQTIADLHTYFMSQEPSYTNEYTGMFEGYNLIWVIAESFSPGVIDAERTPTLYKMANSSFVFNNFYTPYFHVSTSDGEYTTLNGMLPKDDVWSFYRSSFIEMPFGFGNMMTPMGYTCRGYHDHDYDYYDRNLSHPNWGMIWKGYGNGVDVDYTWPESDLQFVELTVPEFINDEPFMTYYLTVSGHALYNFEGNYMAIKNQEYTADMDASVDIKAYLAANMEVEFAMKYLLEQLEAAGIADHTVIALTADHYPYMLSDEDLSSIYGFDVTQDFNKYRNSFILYCPGMEETVVVDKVGCNLDVYPTLANLFRLPYDSRMVNGRDLLSDSEGLVIFGDRSFLNDRFMYNELTEEAKSFTGEEVTQEEIDAVKLEIYNKYLVSAAILDNNYYSYLKDSLPWWDGTTYGHLYDPEEEDSHAD
ncbi:MAG: sulfatase-like hydrolase/transferase [Firmicutes bacterium]|nr:sulfatase-like hydrolase/transferase [Bacillota bacterium]